MSKIERYIIWVLLFLTIVVVIFLAFENFNQNKIVFANTQEVYNSFEMKKELEKDYKKVVENRQNILDSLKFNIQTIYNLYQNNSKDKELEIKYATLVNQYKQKNKEIEEDNSALSGQYDRQIWNQLNQYIKDFGKTNNYKIILGAFGNGSLLYMDENDNVTDDIIKYVNLKYSGNEK